MISRVCVHLIQYTCTYNENQIYSVLNITTNILKKIQNCYCINIMVILMLSKLVMQIFLFVNSSYLFMDYGKTQPS